MTLTRRILFAAFGAAMLAVTSAASAWAISAGDTVSASLSATDAKGAERKLTDLGGDKGSIYILFRSANW